MSRPRTPERDQIIRRLLLGFTTKEIAFELGRTAGGVSKIASNAGVKKQYVTDLEFRQLLNQRKGTQ
jgi:DNA-binding NarL/FixJ family response regulator